MPYFVREFADFEVSDSLDCEFDKAVMVSSTDVYNAATGSGHDESTRVLQAHSLLKFEDEYRRACERRGIPPTILRCPAIVGTGMTGLPREMVNKIYRGTYMHIKGVEEHLSVIHASDVAKAAACCLDSGMTLIATDGEDPTYSSLAEGLQTRPETHIHHQRAVGAMALQLGTVQHPYQHTYIQQPAPAAGIRVPPYSGMPVPDNPRLRR